MNRIYWVVAGFVLLSGIEIRAERPLSYAFKDVCPNLSAYPSDEYSGLRNSLEHMFRLVGVRFESERSFSPEECDRAHALLVDSRTLVFEDGEPSYRMALEFQNAETISVRPRWPQACNYLENVRGFSNLKTLDVVSCEGLSDDIIRKIQTVTQVESLIALGGSDLSILATLPKLRSLDLRGVHAPNGARIRLPWLRKLKHLEAFALNDAFSNEEYVDQGSLEPFEFGDLRPFALQLKALRLAGIDLGSDLRELKPFTELEHLSVASVLKRVDGVEVLSKLRTFKLNSSYIKHGEGCVLTDMSALNGAALLEVFVVRGVPVYPCGDVLSLPRLSLPAVRDLQVHAITIPEGALDGMPALQSLRADVYRVASLNVFRYNSNLESVDLSIESQLDHKLKLSDLEGLRRLKSFSVEGYMFDDFVNAALPALEFLKVSVSRQTSLVGLETMPRLQELNLRDTLVSDVTPLKDAVQLKKLNLTCTSVQDLSPLAEAISHGLVVTGFREQGPGCRIER